MTATAVLQSALDPRGPQAALIAHLWWWLFWISVIVTILVVGAFAFAIVRRPDATPGNARDVVHATSEEESRFGRGVLTATAATVITLFGLLVFSVMTARATTSAAQGAAVTVNIVGHQFWWEIEYDDATPSLRVRTANEIHLPIHRPAVLKVTSRDVIHSFWVPNLNGKRDLIPGYTTAIWMQADQPGVYRGQCAEFCGRQHAHMGFEVIAETESDFQRWLESQRQPARTPDTDAALRGRDVFMRSQCVLCHTITGTDAHGQAGPDLTHVSSREKIAAATLQNASPHLEQWIRDPQGVKPGSQMPPTPLANADLEALVAYLDTLK